MLACYDAKRRIVEGCINAFENSARKYRGKIWKNLLQTISKESISISESFTRGSSLGYGRFGMVSEGGELIGYGSVFKKEAEMDPETGHAIGGRVSPYYVSVAQAVELSVNVETGVVRVHRIVAAHDAGKAINPGIVRNQIIGSVMMGLSEL